MRHYVDADPYHFHSKAMIMYFRPFKLTNTATSFPSMSKLPPQRHQISHQIYRKWPQVLFFLCIRTQQAFHRSSTFMSSYSWYNWGLLVSGYYPSIYILLLYSQTCPRLSTRLSFRMNSNILPFAILCLWTMYIKPMWFYHTL